MARKIIIDTDPGIDDAMAIHLALQSPEVEVIGITTIHGNVYTQFATSNFMHLLEVAGRIDIPVAEGSHGTETKGAELDIDEFILGPDGLENQDFPRRRLKKFEQSAAEFLVQQANKFPEQITVVTLGPLTNIAMALRLDPGFSRKIKQIIMSGGAFSVTGNVTPAAEANMYGDPDAADLVFISGADVLVVGINVTNQVFLTDSDRVNLSNSNGKFSQYLKYHRDETYNTKGVFIPDTVCIAAVIDPSLVTFTEGVVRVQTTGIMKGLTVFYNKHKRFAEVTEWCDKPSVKVADTVDGLAVKELIMERLMK